MKFKIGDKVWYENHRTPYIVKSIKDGRYNLGVEGAEENGLQEIEETSLEERK